MTQASERREGGTAPRIGVLISGRGSNLQALLDAIAAGSLHAQVAVVISNRREAAGLARAAAAGVETLVVEHTAWPSREAYDAELVRELRTREVVLVCLAGFMRLLSPVFIRAFPQAVLNIHPSLLPAFPGAHAHRDTLRHGAKVSGATVHFVDEQLDAGPIVGQESVPVLDDDTETALAARILEVEHRLYPRAVGQVLSGGWRLEGRRFVRDSAR